MKIKEYLKSYEGLTADNRFSKIIIAALLFLTVILSIKSFTQENIVTMQPVTLSDDAWVTQNDSSQSYKEAWGMYLAQLLGNVTPDSVTFIKERITPILAPSIYNEVVELLEVQANQIKQDKVTMRYEPRSVIFEQKTNKVFVTGNSFMRSVGSEEKRTPRTYEFELRMSNYLPVLTFIDNYTEPPHTSDFVDRTNRRKSR